MPNQIENVSYLASEIGPRPAGTEEEQQAAFHIAETLKNDAGLPTVIEEFGGVGDSRLARGICAAVTLVLLLVTFVLPILAVPAIVLCIAAAALYAAESFDNPILSRRLGNGVSQNVVAKYDPGASTANGGRKRKVVIVARYDSGKIRPDLKPPLLSALPVFQKGAIASMFAAPVLLLFRFILVPDAGGIFGLLLALLTLAAIVFTAHPTAVAVIEQVTQYNNAANANASGVAVMLDVAEQIAAGRMQVDDDADFIMHGEEAARAEGVVPEGVELSYDAEVTGEDPEERLAAAKAAIAAISGAPVNVHSVGDIADNLVQVEPPELEQLDEQQRAEVREETREALSTLPEETIADALSHERASIAEETAFTYPDPVMPGPAPTVVATPVVNLPAESSVSVVSADQPQQTPEPEEDFDDPNVPDWYREAKRRARRHDSGKPAQRSHFASALDEAVAESEARFAHPESAVRSVAAEEPAPELKPEPVAEQQIEEIQAIPEDRPMPYESVISPVRDIEEPIAVPVVAPVSDPESVMLEPIPAVPVAERVEVTAEPIEQVEIPVESFEEEAAAPVSEPEPVEAAAVEQPAEDIPAEVIEEPAAEVAVEAAEPAPEIDVTTEFEPVERLGAVLVVEESDPFDEGSVVIDEPEPVVLQAEPELVEVPVIPEPIAVPMAVSAKSAVEPEAEADAPVFASVEEQLPAQEPSDLGETRAMPFVPHTMDIENVEVSVRETAVEREPLREILPSEDMFEVKIRESQPDIKMPSFLETRKIQEEKRTSNANGVGRGSRISIPSVPLDKPIELPEVNNTSKLAPVGELKQQRAPLAEAKTSGHDAAKSLLTSLPSISLNDEASVSDKTIAMPVAVPASPSSSTTGRTPAVNVAGAFVPSSTTGSFAPVGEELVKDMDPEDIYVDDVDDSAYDEGVTETGAFTGPDYVDMPKSRIGGFFKKLRRRKAAKTVDESAQEWLDVDEDFEARSVGAKRGGWESFRDEDVDDASDSGSEDDNRNWEGGGFSPRKMFEAARAAKDDLVANVAEREVVTADYDESEDEVVKVAGVSDAEDDAVEELEEAAAYEAVEAPEYPSLEEQQAEIEQIENFRNPEVNTEVWFVALGSELADHAGLKAFVEEHATELHGAIVIELDALGAGELSLVDQEGVLRQARVTPRMKRYVRKAAQALGIRIPGATLAWNESAASLLQKQNMQAFHLVGMENGKPAFLAQEDDTVEAVDEAKMKEASSLIMEVIKSL